MPEEVKNEEGQAPEEQNAAPEETPGEEVQEEPKGEETPTLWDGIPEDHPVRSEVERLRKESAAKRISAQQAKQESEELKTKLSEAKTAEEVQSLISDYEEKVSALEGAMLRSSVASEYKLPADLAELLKGDDEESLKAHAEKLSRYVPKSQAPSAGDPLGGKKPGEVPVDINSTLAQIKANRR